MTATMVLSPGHALSSISEQTEQRLSQVAQSIAPPPLSEPYPNMPTIVHANEQKALKSEDVIFVQRVEPRPGMCHSLFMVCDGHQGVDAAAFTAQHLPQMLGQSLPRNLPDWNNKPEVEAFAERIRRVLSTAVVELENKWTRNDCMAGTTMTLALVSGWLLTLANTGDSNAILDDGVKVTEITNSHRIQVNKAEQNRLRQGGAQLAPLGFHLQGPAKPQEMGVGPLRLWPGGLCVSRSIGDLDSGALVVPLPHVRQLLLPRHGGLRLIMASDGLWDLVSFTKAAKCTRHKLPHQAVSTLVQMVVKDRRMADDVSIIVVDMLASAATQFPAAALHQAAASSSSGGSSGGGKHRSSGSGGGLFSCFKSPVVIEEKVAPDPRGLYVPWTYLADVDCFEAYPVHANQLAKTSLPQVLPRGPPQGDYTVHGGGRAQMFREANVWQDRTIHGGASTHAGASSGGNPSAAGYSAAGSSHSSQSHLEGAGEGSRGPMEDRMYGGSLHQGDFSVRGTPLPPTALQQAGGNGPLPVGFSGVRGAGVAPNGESMPVEVAPQPLARSNSEIFERDDERRDSVEMDARRTFPSVGSAPVGFSGSALSPGNSTLAGADEDELSGVACALSPVGSGQGKSSGM